MQTSVLSYTMIPHVCRDNSSEQKLCRIGHTHMVFLSSGFVCAHVGCFCPRMLCCTWGTWMAFRPCVCGYGPGEATDGRTFYHKRSTHILDCVYERACCRRAWRRKLSHNKDTSWPFCHSLTGVFGGGVLGLMMLSIFCHSLGKRVCLQHWSHPRPSPPTYLDDNPVS